MVSPLGRGRRPEDAPAWLPALNSLIWLVDWRKRNCGGVGR